MIPDLSVEGNATLWARLEAAKRRLFYTLLRLGLPLENRADDPEHGLAFDFLADAPQSHAQGVMTGHDNGLITLALREADDAVREKVRGEMGEPYRTLLGHFRHESGHYFWDRLVADNEKMLEEFRACSAMSARIMTRRCNAITRKARRPAGRIISSASMPPPIPGRISPKPGRIICTSWTRWKRRAPSASRSSPRAAHGELSAEVDFDAHNAASMAQLIDAWLPIAFAVNSLNRSMGQPDLYPFVLAPTAIEKLAFVHELTHPAVQSGRAPLKQLTNAAAFHSHFDTSQFRTCRIETRRLPTTLFRRPRKGPSQKESVVKVATYGALMGALLAISAVETAQAARLHHGVQGAAPYQGGAPCPGACDSSAPAGAAYAQSCYDYRSSSHVGEVFVRNVPAPVAYAG